MAAPILSGKNIDQDQNEEEEEEANLLGNARSKGVDCVQLFPQRTGDGNTKNTSAQSKHENCWDLNRKKKSNCRNPAMGLDAVLRNENAGSPPLF